MLESIEEIRTFCRIVDEGSLSAASRSMSLSVNAVSRRLAQLEARLGVRLAERTTRTLRVTDEGRIFYERGQHILAAVEDVEESLTPAPRGLKGLVRVAVHPTLVQAPLMRRLEGLLDDNEGLRLHLLARNASIDPVREGVDVAMWPGPVTIQSVVAKKVSEPAWVLACAPRYAEAQALPKTPSDLRDHRCLRAIKDRAERVWVLRDDEGRDVEAVPGGRLDCDDTETLRRLLYAGLGIGLRPEGEVAAAAAEGTLLRVLPRYAFRPIAVHVVTPPGRLRLRRVRAVAQILEEAIVSSM